METRMIRRTSVAPPVLDEPGRYLANGTSLEGGRGRMAESTTPTVFCATSTSPTRILLDGRITDLKNCEFDYSAPTSCRTTAPPRVSIRLPSTLG